MNASTALAPVASLQPACVSLGVLSASSPAALVDGASQMATELAEVIRSQNLSTVIQGRHYVQVEGWTTLGVMLGVTAREVSTTEQEGIYTSIVELVRMADGAVISRASAECGEEKPWNARPRYARRSMAQCVPLDSEILTRFGFQPYYNLQVGQEVLAYDCATNACRWVPLLAVSAFEDQPVIKMQSRSFDFTCTANHSWAVRSDRGYFKLQEADCIDARGSIIIAAPCTSDHAQYLDLSPREASILGWLVTDGNMRNPKGNHWRGHIDQTAKHVDTLINLLGDEWITSITTATPDPSNKAANGKPWGVLPCTRFALRSAAVASLVRRAGYTSKADLPSIVTRLSPGCRAAMLTAMVQADGHTKPSGRFNFAKKDKSVMDCFLILCALQGIATGRKSTSFPRYSARANPVAHNKWVQRSKAGSQDVWCPTTELGTWVMRQGGMVSITGNTRATGKACRLAFSWIMKLAGYEPTPAEEMPQPDQPAAPTAPDPKPAPIRAAPPEQSNGATITAKQHTLLEAQITRLALDRERVKSWVHRAWGVEHLDQVPASKLNELLNRLGAWHQAARPVAPPAEDMDPGRPVDADWFAS